MKRGMKLSHVQLNQGGLVVVGAFSLPGGGRLAGRVGAHRVH